MKRIIAFVMVLGTFLGSGMGIAAAGELPNGMTFEHSEFCDGTSQWFFTNPTSETLTVNLSSVFPSSVPEADDSDAGSLPVSVYPYQTSRNTFLYAYPSEYLLWLDGVLIERGPLTFPCPDPNAQPVVSETSTTTTSTTAPTTSTTATPQPVVIAAPVPVSQPPAPIPAIRWQPICLLRFGPF